MGHFYFRDNLVKNFFLTTTFCIDWKKLALRASHTFSRWRNRNFPFYIYIFSDVVSCLSIREFFSHSLDDSQHTKNCDNVNFFVQLSPQSTATATGIWINISCCKWIRAWQSASVFCVWSSQLIDENSLIASSLRVF